MTIFIEGAHHLEIMTQPMHTHLWHIHDKQASHNWGSNCEHSKSIRWIDEQVLGEHKAERSPYAHHNHHYECCNGEVVWVIDKMVMDIAALVS